MSDLFLPSQFLKRVLPEGFFKRKILNRNLSIKRTLLRALLTATTLSGEEIRESLGKVVEFYHDKIEKLEDEGIKKPMIKAVNDEKLLKMRVENLVTWNESQRLKEENKGKKYIWLPSSSEEPRINHQLRYGKIYTVGDGVFPGEEYGCKCGALILDDDEDNDILTLEQKNLIEKQRDYERNSRVARELNKIVGTK